MWANMSRLRKTGDLGISMSMDSDLAQSTLNVSMAVCGLVALVWAFAAGQFQEMEDAKYTVDGAVDDSPARRPQPSVRRFLTAIGLIAVLVSIAGSLMLTVAAAAGKPSPAKSTASALKCPFE